MYNNKKVLPKFHMVTRKRKNDNLHEAAKETNSLKRSTELDVKFPNVDAVNHPKTNGMMNKISEKSKTSEMEIPEKQPDTSEQEYPIIKKSNEAPSDDWLRQLILAQTINFPGPSAIFSKNTVDECLAQPNSSGRDHPLVRNCSEAAPMAQRNNLPEQSVKEQNVEKVQKIPVTANTKPLRKCKTCKQDIARGDIAYDLKINLCRKCLKTRIKQMNDDRALKRTIEIWKNKSTPVTTNQRQLESDAAGCSAPIPPDEVDHEIHASATATHKKPIKIVRKPRKNPEEETTDGLREIDQVDHEVHSFATVTQKKPLIIAKKPRGNPEAVTDGLNEIDEVDHEMQVSATVTQKKPIKTARKPRGNPEAVTGGLREADEVNQEIHDCATVSQKKPIKKVRKSPKNPKETRSGLNEIDEVDHEIHVSATVTQKKPIKQVRSPRKNPSTRKQAIPKQPVKSTRRTENMLFARKDPSLISSRSKALPPSQPVGQYWTESCSVCESTRSVNYIHPASETPVCCMCYTYYIQNRRDRSSEQIKQSEVARENFNLKCSVCRSGIFYYRRVHPETKELICPGCFQKELQKNREAMQRKKDEDAAKFVTNKICSYCHIRVLGKDARCFAGKGKAFCGHCVNVLEAKRARTGCKSRATCEISFLTPKEEPADIITLDNTPLYRCVKCDTIVPNFHTNVHSPEQTWVCIHCCQYYLCDKIGKDELDMRTRIVKGVKLHMETLIANPAKFQFMLFSSDDDMETQIVGDSESSNSSIGPTQTNLSSKGSYPVWAVINKAKQSKVQLTTCLLAGSNALVSIRKASNILEDTRRVLDDDFENPLLEIPLGDDTEHEMDNGSITNDSNRSDTDGFAKSGKVSSEENLLEKRSILDRFHLKSTLPAHFSADDVERHNKSNGESEMGRNSESTRQKLDDPLSSDDRNIVDEMKNSQAPPVTANGSPSTDFRKVETSSQTELPAPSSSDESTTSLHRAHFKSTSPTAIIPATSSDIAVRKHNEDFETETKSNGSFNISNLLSEPVQTIPVTRNGFNTSHLIGDSKTSKNPYRKDSSASKAIRNNSCSLLSPRNTFNIANFLQNETDPVVLDLSVNNNMWYPMNFDHNVANPLFWNWGLHMELFNNFLMSGNNQLMYNSGTFGNIKCVGTPHPASMATHHSSSDPSASHDNEKVSNDITRNDSEDPIPNEQLQTLSCTENALLKNEFNIMDVFGEIFGDATPASPVEKSFGLDDEHRAEETIESVKKISRKTFLMSNILDSSREHSATVANDVVDVVAEEEKGSEDTSQEVATRTETKTTENGPVDQSQKQNVENDSDEFEELPGDKTKSIEDLQIQLSNPSPLQKNITQQQLVAEKNEEVEKSSDQHQELEADDFDIPQTEDTGCHGNLDMQPFSPPLDHSKNVVNQKPLAGEPNEKKKGLSETPIREAETEERTNEVPRREAESYEDQKPEEITAEQKLYVEFSKAVKVNLTDAGDKQSSETATEDDSLGTPEILAKSYGKPKVLQPTDHENLEFSCPAKSAEPSVPPEKPTQKTEYQAVECPKKNPTLNAKENISRSKTSHLVKMSKQLQRFHKSSKKESLKKRCTSCFKKFKLEESSPVGQKKDLCRLCAVKNYYETTTTWEDEEVEIPAIDFTQKGPQFDEETEERPENLMAKEATWDPTAPTTIKNGNINDESDKIVGNQDVERENSAPKDVPTTLVPERTIPASNNFHGFNNLPTTCATPFVGLSDLIFDSLSLINDKDTANFQAPRIDSPTFNVILDDLHQFPFGVEAGNTESLLKPTTEKLFKDMPTLKAYFEPGQTSFEEATKCAETQLGNPTLQVPQQQHTSRLYEILTQKPNPTPWMNFSSANPEAVSQVQPTFPTSNFAPYQVPPSYPAIPHAAITYPTNPYTDYYKKLQDIANEKVDKSKINSHKKTYPPPICAVQICGKPLTDEMVYLHPMTKFRICQSCFWFLQMGTRPPTQLHCSFRCRNCCAPIVLLVDSFQHPVTKQPTCRKCYDFYFLHGFDRNDYHKPFDDFFPGPSSSTASTSSSSQLFCLTCGQAFHNRISLYRHGVDTKHRTKASTYYLPKTEKTFVCFECKMSFKNRHGLWAHSKQTAHVVRLKRTFTMKDGFYSCSRCSYKSEKIYNLRQHIRWMHLD